MWPSGVVLETVDNYQGYENKIVILSLGKTFNYFITLSLLFYRLFGKFYCSLAVKLLRQNR